MANDDGTRSEEISPACVDCISRLVAELTPTLQYVYDIGEHREVWVNRALTSVLGYPEVELAQFGRHSIAHLLHPDDAAQCEPHLARLRALRDGELAETEFRMKRHDGAWVWLQCREMVFRRGADGSVRQVIGSGLDVTAQKEAASAMLASEARFRQLAEEVPQCVWETDAAGNATFQNGRWETYTGVALQDARQHGWMRVLHPDDMAHVADAWRLSLQTGSDYEVCCRYRRAADGAYRWFTVRATPRRDAQGNIVRWVGTSTDVHDRHLAEEARRESEERFRTMADGLPLIVWVHDAAGALQFINRRYAEFFDVRIEQVRGDGWCMLIHPQDLEAYTGEFEASLQERRPFHAEVRVKSATGQWRCVESWAQPRFAADGEFCGLVGASADITERKESEAALAEAHRNLAEALAARDRFLAALSHELRTPLTPVLLIAGVQKRSAALPAEIREDFEAIERNVLTEIRLVDDLLDVARIQSGKLRYQMALCDIVACIDRAVAMVRPEADAKPVDFETERGEHPCEVPGDSERLLQLFCNLLRNAIKFSPPHASVRVMVMVDGHSVHVGVRDHGVGLASEDLHRIFRPFEQVETSERREHRSLGLGLSICSAISAAHGGRIWAESEGLGRGATFWVALPLAGYDAAGDPVR